MPRKHKIHPSKSQTHSKYRQRLNTYSKVDEIDDEDNWQRDVHICMVTGTILLAIYYKCLYPSIPGGDAGELVVSAYEGGVAHPPGYPLFTLLSKLFLVVLPRGSPAWKVNFLTAVCSSVAGALLQLTVLRITGCVGSSFLAVGLFSVNKLTWTWSVAAEVFSLNNLFIGALMCLAVVFEVDDDPEHVEKIACIGTFVSGLALCNQHTIVIYIICIAFWVILRLLKLQMLTWRLVLKLVVLFLLGLSPYLYLPISSFLNTARWTWGDHRTLEGFLTHFLRREYGTFDLGKDQIGSGFWVATKAYWEHAHEDLCELGPFLALIGVAVAFIWRVRNEGTSVFVFAIMFVIYTTFFAWRANLDINNDLFRGVIERFWMQSDMVLALLASVGFSMAVRLITEHLMGSKQLPMSSVFAMMGAGIIIILQMKNFLVCDQSSNDVIQNFAKSLLNKMPKNAIVLSKGDLPTNTMRYFHLCENVRPDLTILDVEVLSYSWFLPLMKKFYPRITFPGDRWYLTNQRLPDGTRTFNFRALLEKNQEKHPIISCIGMQERDPSWKDSFYTLPFGPCQRVVPYNFQFDPVLWANQTGGFADDWNHSHDDKRFPKESWEKVANDEMWQAKISTAFFMYQKAQTTEDKHLKTQLLLQSYQLYFRAIKINQIPGRLITKESFPHFWYKNFALACEKLLHLEHDMDNNKLYRLAISNFKQYIHLEPNDPDAEKIEEAIDILTQRLDTMQKIDKVDMHLENMAKRMDKMGVADLIDNS